MRSNKLLFYTALMAAGFLQFGGLPALNLQLSKDRQTLVQEVNKAIQERDFEKAGEGIEQFRRANQKYQVRELSKKLTAARIAALKEAKPAVKPAEPKPEPKPKPEPEPEVVVVEEKEPAAPPIKTAAEIKQEKEAREKRYLDEHPKRSAEFNQALFALEDKPFIFALGKAIGTAIDSEQIKNEIALPLLKTLARVDDWSAVEAPPALLGALGGKGALKFEGAGDQSKVFVQLTGGKTVDVTDLFNDFVSAIGGKIKTVKMDMFDGVHGAITAASKSLIEAAGGTETGDTPFKRVQRFVGESKKDSDGDVSGHGYLSGAINTFTQSLRQKASAPVRKQEEADQLRQTLQQKAAALKDSNPFLFSVANGLAELVTSKKLDPSLDPQLADILLEIFREVDSKGDLAKVNVGGTVIAVVKDDEGKKRVLITQDKWSEGIASGLWSAMTGQKSIWTDFDKAIDVTNQFDQLAKIPGTVDKKVLKAIHDRLASGEQSLKRSGLLRIIGFRKGGDNKDDDPQYYRSLLLDKLREFMQTEKKALDPAE